MGCCYSCKESGSPQGGEVNERTHLLVDPTSINNTVIQRVHSDDILTRYPNSLPKKTDEQSALNRILQEIATNVIDVAALGSHALEQHDYLERVKHYSQRLQLAGQWGGSLNHHICVLTDVPAPERWLAAEPIHPSDQSLINSVVEKANSALLALKVEHKEDLVVPFIIP